MPRQLKIIKFTEALKKVLETPNIISLTDDELLVLVNSTLPKEDRVGSSTFKAWKGTGKAKKSLENTGKVDQDMIDDFREAMDLARVHQKLKLTDSALNYRNTKDGNNNPGGAMWLLKKKFVDMKDEPQGISIGEGGIKLLIQTNDSETKNLIDSIDIDHEDLTGQKELRE